ncbi:hypothetical protein MPSEU_000535500 [Mayamaea pseudoterrestris]|nr:hypothetical protein MPSEU_000535500 [Mayamaea pseudoterrestris]
MALSMFSSQFCSLTRQLHRVALSQSPQSFRRPIPIATQLTTRPFASKKKGPPKSKSNSKHRNAPATASSKAPAESASASHQEWVKFQNAIAVEGFETGQVVDASNAGKKPRGGKAARGKDRMRKALDEKLAERQRLTESGGGQFPPMRYEDSETERLLAEAYAAIPERAGKRGTRNLKRQSKRWFLVRQIHAKYKNHMARFQEKKMEKRKDRMAQVREALEAAPAQRAADREYQAKVFQRWAATMALDQGEDLSVVVVDAQDEGKKQNA